MARIDPHINFNGNAEEALFLPISFWWEIYTDYAV